MIKIEGFSYEKINSRFVIGIKLLNLQPGQVVELFTISKPVN